MAHILLIEPNSVLAEVYTQALQHAGHSVAHAVGAQAAIDAADAKPPQLVVLELQLPGHSGLEFLHEFRSYPEWANVPVVVHTMLPPSKLAPARDALAKDLGVTTVLYKPQTTLEDLTQVASRFEAASSV